VPEIITHQPVRRIRLRHLLDGGHQLEHVPSTPPICRRGFVSLNTFVRIKLSAMSVGSRRVRSISSARAQYRRAAREVQTKHLWP